jgi:undecaprenyl-diphosphatase
MEYLAVAALAIVQGLTEFLPVSSSGHLVIAQRLLGWNNANVVLDAVLHLGTALAIVVVYRKDLRDLAAGLFSPDRVRRTGSLRTVALLAIGTIPAVIAGILLRGFFEKMFSNPQAVSKLFFVSAAFLLAAGLKKKPRAGAVNAPKAAVIGLAQALAILPGVSRSGTTISTGLLLGVDRREAARFSFFLALPVILGAAFLELKDGAAASIAPGLLFAGFAISFAVGVAALKILMRFIERGRIGYFAIYLIALGLICSLAF